MGVTGWLQDVGVLGIVKENYVGICAKVDNDVCKSSEAFGNIGGSSQSDCSMELIFVSM